MAAEAAATAAAEVELTTTTAAAPPAEIPSLIPSTQMVRESPHEPHHLFFGVFDSSIDSCGVITNRVCPLVCS